MAERELIAELVEALKWVRQNYASGSTREINARIDGVLAKVSHIRKP